MNKKILLICVPLGSLIFIALFLIEGATRSDYSPTRFPISSLSIGDDGRIQICNFILSGSLIFISAFGFRSALHPSKGSVWIPRLIAAVGIGLIGAGIFSTDPIYGYPSTEPLAIAQFTFHGHLHDLFSIFVFICLPIIIFKFRNRFKKEGNKKLAAYSFLSGIGMIATFILAAIGFKQVHGFVEIAGVFQRISLIFGFTCTAIIAIYLIKKE